MTYLRLVVHSATITTLLGLALACSDSHQVLQSADAANTDAGTSPDAIVGLDTGTDSSDVTSPGVCESGIRLLDEEPMLIAQISGDIQPHLVWNDAYLAVVTHDDISRYDSYEAGVEFFDQDGNSLAHWTRFGVSYDGTGYDGEFGYTKLLSAMPNPSDTSRLLVLVEAQQRAGFPGDTTLGVIEFDSSRRASIYQAELFPGAPSPRLGPRIEHAIPSPRGGFEAILTNRAENTRRGFYNDAQMVRLQVGTPTDVVPFHDNQLIKDGRLHYAEGIGPLATYISVLDWPPTVFSSTTENTFGNELAPCSPTDHYTSHVAPDGTVTTLSACDAGFQRTHLLTTNTNPSRIGEPTLVHTGDGLGTMAVFRDRVGTAIATNEGTDVRFFDGGDEPFRTGTLHPLTDPVRRIAITSLDGKKWAVVRIAGLNAYVDRFELCE